MASCVSTTPFGWPDVPEVATTRASPSSTGMPSAQCVLLAVGANNPGGSKSVQHRVAGDEGKTGVERGGSISGVPDGLECIDKARMPPGRSSATSSGTGQ